MAHDHHDHDHHHDGDEHGAGDAAASRVNAGDGRRRLRWALLTSGVFLIAELIGGLVANSLALLADAGHMFADVVALTLALAASRLGERPADSRHTYGRDRIQVLAAFVNGLLLLALTIWLVVEALQRFWNPQPVQAVTVLAVGGVGLAANLLAFLILHRGDRQDMNLRGAALHVLSDLLGSVAAIAAALVILATGWMAADPLLSLLTALLILRLAFLLLRRTGLILLEASPEDLSMPELRSSLLAAIPGVRDVHHVHVWSLTPRRRMITLHACVDPQTVHAQVLRDIQGYLARRYRISHCTVQLEHDDSCTDASDSATESRRVSADTPCP